MYWRQNLGKDLMHLVRKGDQDPRLDDGQDLPGPTVHELSVLKVEVPRYYLRGSGLNSYHIFEVKVSWCKVFTQQRNS